MGIDAIIALLGIGIPPIFDFIKKKFLKPSQDSPEATISSLATTKPEVLADYTTAVGTLFEAKTKWFNRDVIGNIPQWVSAWRACIRPFIVTAGIIHIIAGHFYQLPVEQGIRLFYIAVISEWCGERLTLDK